MYIQIWELGEKGDSFEATPKIGGKKKPTHKKAILLGVLHTPALKATVQAGVFMNERAFSVPDV